MTEKNIFTDDINNLIWELEGSSNPRDKKLAKKAKKMQANQKKFDKSLADIQESLDYLRICIKYQVFDLEATRRENEYLRKLLEEGMEEEEYGNPDDLIG